MNNLRFRDNSIELIDAEKLSEFVKLRAYEKITVLPPVRLNQIVSFSLKMCQSSIFEDLQEFFAKEEEKIEKVQKEKVKFLIASTSKFGQIVQMRNNKQGLFNLMRLFISSLSSIWIKIQIKSKKSIMCSLENHVDFLPKVNT